MGAAQAPSTRRPRRIRSERSRRPCPRWRRPTARRCAPAISASTGNATPTSSPRSRRSSTEWAGGRAGRRPRRRDARDRRPAALGRQPRAAPQDRSRRPRCGRPTSGFASASPGRAPRAGRAGGTCPTCRWRSSTRYWEEAKKEELDRRRLLHQLAHPHQPHSPRPPAPAAPSPAPRASPGTDVRSPRRSPSCCARRTSSSSCAADRRPRSRRRPGRRAATRPAPTASSAVFSATVASVVRLSRKKRPRAREHADDGAHHARVGRRRRAHVVVDADGAGHGGEVLLERPRDLGVRLRPQDEARARAAPSGSPSGSIGRCRRTSLPPRCEGLRRGRAPAQSRQHGARDRLRASRRSARPARARCRDRRSRSRRAATPATGGALLGRPGHRPGRQAAAGARARAAAAAPSGCGTGAARGRDGQDLK